MNIKLENNNQQAIGQLQSMQYIAEDGAPVKADLYYVTYELCLGDQIIDGLYSDKFLIHDSLLFITALDIKITDEGTGVLMGSSLVAIDLNTLQITQLSQLKNGYVYAKETEGNKIVYSKQLLNSSAIKEYDQSIDHLLK